MTNFEQLVTLRRSIYNLGRNLKLSNQEIDKLIERMVKYCPSAFNSQSGRVIILHDDSHLKLWSIVLEQVRQIVPPEHFTASESKIKSFADGQGTVLFFIDDETTTVLQQKFPLYSANFPVWAEQAGGMLQYMVWTILAEHNIGASLQHYNPLIDNDVRSEFSVPSSWRLIAQMPFGSVEAPADEKTFLPLADRVKIFN